MRVLLLGDYCTDVFVYGDCPRLSPEVPVPVFEECERVESAGMAGNVLANLRSLAPGIEVVTLYSHCGRKVRYVDRRTGHHFLRVDAAESPDVLGLDALRAVLAENNFDAVVVSDYAKGFLTAETLWACDDWCADKGVPFFVDTKRLLGNWSRHAIVKINNAEYSHQVESGVDIRACCKAMIWTAGRDGMTMLHPESLAIAVRPIEVRDGAGCGDSVLAALVVRYLENGGNLKTAMEWAAKAGAVAVSHRGVVAVKREDVEPC